MRKAILFALISVGSLAAAALVAASPSMEADTARLGGVYTRLTTSDAEACAAQCARDGICLAWTWRASSCELKAIVPEPIAESGAVSGLSARAPAFAQRVTPTPAPMAAAAETADASHPEAMRAEPDAALALLGGPHEYDAAGLRVRN